jgi:glycogen debranching enzyme
VRLHLDGMQRIRLSHNLQEQQFQSCALSAASCSTATKHMHRTLATKYVPGRNLHTFTQHLYLQMSPDDMQAIFSTVTATPWLAVAISQQPNLLLFIPGRRQ